MNDAVNKKEMKSEYKSKKVVGGIYCIECSGNKRRWVKSTTNLKGIQNRFEFAMLTKTSPEPSMRDEWSKYGSESFSFAVLEELEKKEEQTSREFAQDIDALLDMWLEK